MTSSPFPVPAKAYIEATRANPELAAIAVALFAKHSASLLVRPPKTAITRSDAGRCGAQVAAEIAGEYDIPDSGFESRDKGSLLGLWRACFLKVAIETRHPDWYCLLEVERDYNGIVGHSDLTAYERARNLAWWTWETKSVEKFDVIAPHLPVLSKKDGRVLHEPNLRYITQTGLGALAEGSPGFSVSVFGIGGAYAQGDYITAEWEQAVEDEYARVARGEMDPTMDYQCKSCRVGRCPKNRNENRPAYWDALDVEVPDEDLVLLA